MRLQTAVTATLLLSAFTVFACCDFKPAFALTICLMGALVPFVLQVQTARMAQGGHLAWCSNLQQPSADLVPNCRKPEFRCHSAAQGTRALFWVSGKEAPAGVRESKEVRTLAFVLVKLSQRLTLRISLIQKR